MKQTFLLLLVLGLSLPALKAQRVIEGKSPTYRYEVSEDPPVQRYIFRGGALVIEGRSRAGRYSIVIGGENDRLPSDKRYTHRREDRNGDRYSRQRDQRIVPPYLEIEPNSLDLADDNGNKRIDAGEMAYLEFELQNRGRGEALDMEVNIAQKTHLQGLDFEPRMRLGRLSAERSRRVRIPIRATEELPSGVVIFEVQVSERNGFGADPIEVEISTHESYKPQLAINDYQILSSSRKLVKKVPFDIELLVQNRGRGNAEAVRIRVELPPNVLNLSADDEWYLGELPPGEAQKVSFSLIANDKFEGSSIPLRFVIEESSGRFGTQKALELQMGQKERTLIKLQPDARDEPDRQIEVAYLGSDVDRNIPENPRRHPQRYVLIFGNEDYTTYQRQLTSEANVDFARADAETFARYAELTLGVPRENITIEINAISTVMRREIKRFIDKAKYTDGEVELIFYYSGHGFPDKETGEAYLMPVDISGEEVRQGIQLSQLYKDLTQYPAKRVTVFLDACFSGGGRNLGLLAARGIRIKPKENLIEDGKLVVFSASRGEQESLAYREKGHGMFSYWLFKKLQQSDQYLTYGELAEYLDQMVPLTSSDVNYKEQQPTINISRDAIGKWQNWQVK